MIDCAKLGKICELLSECELHGCKAFLGANGLANVCNPSALPAKLLDSLRSEKAAIAEYLRQFPQPMPSVVPCISRRMEVASVPSAYLQGALFVFFGEVPYYRLTPEVFVWLHGAIGGLLDGERRESASMAFPLLSSLESWLCAHYRPHEIWAARRRMIGLPKADYVDRSIPDHRGSLADWQESWKMQWDSGAKKYKRV